MGTLVQFVQVCAEQSWVDGKVPEGMGWGAVHTEDTAAGSSYLSEIPSPLVQAAVTAVQVGNSTNGMVLVGRALMFTGRFCTSDIFLLQPIGFINNSRQTN